MLLSANSRLVVTMSVALLLGGIGNSGFAFHIPYLMQEWELGPDDIGWITTALNLSYMFGAPLLVMLTDRIDARVVFAGSVVLYAGTSLLFATGHGFWIGFGAQFLAGIAMSGTFMPGMRILGDRIDGKAGSRAVTIYMASFSIGSAVSFLVMGQLSPWLGPRMAFAVTALGPLLASMIVLFGVPAIAKTKNEDSEDTTGGLMQVIRDPNVMSKSFAWASNNFELFGLMPWVVTFLTFLQVSQTAGPFEVNISALAAIMALVSLPASIVGNELAVRYGFRITCSIIMLVSACVGFSFGFTLFAWPAMAIAVMLFVLGITSAADQSALTASLIAEAPPALRGRAMAVYSAVGSVGALLGPLLFGIVLATSPDDPRSWAMAFATLATGALIGPIALNLGGWLARRKGKTE